MCPERALLSVYVDSELDLRKAQRVETHVAACDSCRRHLRAYQRVSHALLESHEPDVNAAGDRVWRRLDLVLQSVRAERRSGPEACRLPHRLPWPPWRVSPC